MPPPTPLILPRFTFWRQRHLKGQDHLILIQRLQIEMGKAQVGLRTLEGQYKREKKEAEKTVS